MKEKPIIFSTPMVQAILEGRKTMTRRVVSEKLLEKYYDYEDWCNTVGLPNCQVERQYYNEKEYLDGKCKYKVGDILWVRETWNEFICDSECVGRHFAYKANNNDYNPKYLYKHWKPSIHMPKEAARIFLKVTDVRVERLQDISIEDARKEGIEIALNNTDFMYQFNFRILWDTINKKRGYSWDSNPWVWVIEFRKMYE